MRKARPRSRAKRSRAEVRVLAPELLAEAVEAHFGRLRSSLPARGSAPSKTAVHDLRVAARRLLTVLELAEGVVPGKIERGTRRALRRLLKRLGPIRDLFVEARALRPLLEREPEAVRSVRAMLRRERERRLAAVVRKLDRFDARALSTELAALRDELAAVSRETTRLSAATVHLPGAAAASYAAFRNRLSEVTPADPESLHRMRIAFKRYRYGVEVLAPILPGNREERLRGLGAFQDRVGELHDREVLLETLCEARLSKRVRKRKRLAQLASELREEHRAELVRFVAELPSLAPRWDT